ncbi:MAG: tRNA preQ1(34) S-adenosylmethionine ribosyltransferase-isomerase QueA [Helicobacteraceae bacterium]|nr:tRNA preQ1(34) S-adenosylmethionine ribosyltransferase-isomerase QueA [Helicobacteraceae bacterium]
MMQPDPLKTSSYDFTLPPELIATHPVEPRDHARLLVYDRATDTITHSRFDALDSLLPKECAIIFNDTKVIKARLYGYKSSGGKLELLINRPLDAYNVNVYIRGKVKTDTALYFEEGFSAKVITLHDDGSRDVHFYLNGTQLRFEEILPIIDKQGHIPLPPYIQREDGKEDEADYQSVFAKHEGAVAAPTASLHFTQNQFEEICNNHPHASVTLHVGAGTFKPVDSEIITDHPMHSEYYNISPEAKKLFDSNLPLLCVGTTSTRTIEFHARHLDQLSGEANLFLHPGNRPLRVNHLLTNFHLPQSTLLMLVASFVGVDKAHELYREAIENKYRFYSYGDAMLLL